MFQRSRFPFRSLWLLPILPAILALIYGFGAAPTARAADGPPPFPPPPQGTIIVIKDTQPDALQDFSYNLYYYEPVFGLQAQFSLDDDGTDLNPLSNTYQTTVTAGKYGVSEAGTAGWDLDSLGCVSTNPLRVFPGPSYDPNNNGTGIAFDIDAGETITCTFTNSLITADLTILKETDPDGGTGFPFTLDPGVVTFITEWGSFGSGDGEFWGLRGMAVDGAGNVYVADIFNNRIQKFDSDGNYLTRWGANGGDGSSGSGDSEFNNPIGVAVDGDGNVYVTDRNNHRVQKFDVDGNYLDQWGSSGSGDGEFATPEGVAVDRFGNVYVVDTDNHRIQKFDGDGNYLDQWGSNGSGDGEFNVPQGLAVDGAGNVYVADRFNHRIQKFDDDGNYLDQWGSSGSGDGEFNNPIAVAVDRAGNVYVVELLNHRIQKFDADGNYLDQWGSSGSGDGEFAFPEGLVVDGAGNVYVADTDNDRVQKFSQFGETLDDGQSHTFTDLVAGSYLVSELVPEGWELTDIDCDGGSPDENGNTVEVTLAAGDDVTCTFTNGLVPTTADIYTSARTAGTTGDGLDFGSEDIIQWDGSAWSMWFDGSAAGLTPTGKARHDNNAFWIPDPSGDDVVMSFTQNRRRVPGIANPVDGMDLVRWDGSAFTLYFDGSDVGLTNKTEEKIDALHILDGSESPVGAGCLSYLLISTQGPGKVPNHSGGVLKFGGEDVLGFCATSLGETTTGLWHLVIDGSAEGMPRNSTDSISVSEDGGTLYLTTQGVFNVDAAAGGHSMVYEYDFGAGTFSGPIFSAPAKGLPGKVDGLQMN